MAEICIWMRLLVDENSTEARAVVFSAAARDFECGPWVWDCLVWKCRRRERLGVILPGRVAKQLKLRMRVNIRQKAQNEKMGKQAKKEEPSAGNVPCGTELFYPFSLSPSLS